MIFSQRKTALLISISIISAILLSAAPVSAEDDGIIDLKKGYVVTSVHGKNISEREEIESPQADFWETSSQMIIDTIMTENIPFFEEIIILISSSVFFSGIISFFGFKRINQKNALDNENRSEIYEFIEKNPGIYFTEIVKELGITKTMAKYHLDKLIRYERICLYSENGRSGYFRNSGFFSNTDMKLLLAQKNPNDRIILGIVYSNPGITRKEIITKINLSGPSVTWHMKNLEKSGLIDVVRERKVTRYYIKPDCDLLYSI